MLPAVTDDLVTARDQLAAIVRRQVQLVGERALVDADDLGEELVEHFAPRRLRQSVLQRALDEHRGRRVEAMRGRVLSPKAGCVLDVLEDPLAERFVVVRRGQQKLRLLDVERLSLNDGAAGRAEHAREPAALERGRDGRQVLDEPVVEGQQTGVVPPVSAAEVTQANGRVALRDMVELALELCRGPRRHRARVPDVVVHHDRQRHYAGFSNVETNALQNASPSGRPSSARCHASATRL